MRPTSIRFHTSSADTQKNILLDIYCGVTSRRSPSGGKCWAEVYISVIQKQSFLSLPMTQRGSVRCQLRPDPTAAEPIITGWNDKSSSSMRRSYRGRLPDNSHTLTCGWPRWWMNNWLLSFPGHPVVAKRFSLARDHLRTSIVTLLYIA